MITIKSILPKQILLEKREVNKGTSCTHQQTRITINNKDPSPST